jgi:hypothetical protein
MIYRHSLTTEHTEHSLFGLVLSCSVISVSSVVQAVKP